MLIEPPLLAFLFFIALITGFVKTGLPALGSLISVLMVLVFPPKDALGLTLLYLLAGDCVAAKLYWNRANKKELLSMLPAIIVGIILGIVLISMVSDAILGLLIGCMIVLLVSLEPFRGTITAWAMVRISWVRGISGGLAGFSTTVGNAAGPIVSLYFLLLKLNKHTFAGTAALFFLIVNLIKLPLYYSIGIFKSEYMLSVLVTIPIVFVGTYLGHRFLQWIPQKSFNKLTLLFTLVAGLLLITRYFL